jgi:hypothetical protein
MKKLILLTTFLLPFMMFSQDRIGADIYGEAGGDNSGSSVSYSSDGTIVAIGARSNDGNGYGSGHVRIYEFSGGTWTQVGADIDGENKGDLSGSSVSLRSDGTIVAIGATMNNGSGSISGHVRIYEYSGSTWTQQGADIDPKAGYSFREFEFGYSVSLSSDGSVVAIGAPGAGYMRGYTGIFIFKGGNWVQHGNIINGGGHGHQAGYSVSLSDNGNKVAIGSTSGYENDDYNNAKGFVRVYDRVIDFAPKIFSVSLAADNSTITVTTDYSVYNSNGGSSNLEASDFSLSISGGSDILTSATPTSISKTSQSVWVLEIELIGGATGEEILTVMPVANSIYFNGQAMNTIQSNNSVYLNNITPFNAIRLSIDNSSVAITANEPYYTSIGGSSALEMADFAFSISGGTATLTSTTPTTISSSGSVTTLGIGLSGTPNGNEILRVNPASATSIYDSSGSALSSKSIIGKNAAGIYLFPNTITATSLTTSAATSAGSLTVDNLVMDGATIGHSSDTDLMTLSSGSLTVAGDIVLSSDARLKSNIVALGPTLISLMQLDAKRYTMKADKEQKQKIGLLAQEVQKVFPELVSEDKNDMLAVNYQALVPVLINALKEQERNYNELEKELSELETLIKEK